MIEQIKKLEIREDGFIEVTLKRVKDFDEYVFSQINKDPNCLYCIRDHRSKVKFHFDSKGYLSLASYLEGHLFEKEEAHDFLIYMFELLVRANTNKPVYLESNFIFISYDAGILKFLVLPLTMDRWVFQSDQSKDFLCELVRLMNIKEGFMIIGILVEMMKKDDLSLPSVLQQLLTIKNTERLSLNWFQRIFQKRKQEETFKILNLPRKEKGNVEYDRLEQPMEETRVLFAKESGISFTDVLTTTCYMVLEEEFMIGRDQGNQLCLPDHFISSNHAVFYRESGILEDKKSSNGTFVNGERVDTCVLADGDIVAFADHRFQFHNFDKEGDEG